MAHQGALSITKRVAAMPDVTWASLTNFIAAAERAIELGHEIIADQNGAPE